MNLTIEFDVEADGRIIAAVPELPGVQVYGKSRGEALTKLVTLAYSVLADEVAHGERTAESLLSVAFATREAA